MSLRKHIRESFFLKWRYKDLLFLYILKEIAERYRYDTNRWLDYNQVVVERDKSLRLQEILKQKQFDKLKEVLMEYFNSMDYKPKNIANSAQSELKNQFHEIVREDKYGYELDRDKEFVRRLYDFL